MDGEALANRDITFGESTDYVLVSIHAALANRDCKIIHVFLSKAFIFVLFYPLIPTFSLFTAPRLIFSFNPQ